MQTRPTEIRPTQIITSRDLETHQIQVEPVPAVVAPANAALAMAKDHITTKPDITPESPLKLKQLVRSAAVQVIAARVAVPDLSDIEHLPFLNVNRT